MNQPGKKTNSPEWGLGGVEHFTLSDYKRLLLRRKWFIILVTFFVAAGTAAAAYFLPNMYKATTVILVDPRKVPDNYVTPTITATVVDRLATLREQILSATRLGEIINELDLYHELKKTRTRDELVERMRKDIEIEVVGGARNDKDLAAFSVSFHSREPVQAARVTNRLASLFIEENVKSREQQVLGTADFIDKELDDAKQELGGKEHDLAQLKSRFASELPESQTLHVQALTSLQIELRGEMDELNRAQQQKLYLQSLLSQGTPVVDLDRSASPELIALQTQVSAAQTELDDLRKHYGPSYPDVVKRSAEVADLEKQIKKIKKEAPPAPPSAQPKAQNPVVASQIAALDQQISKNLERQQEIKNEIAFHQAKLGEIPVVEQQMASIMRDYEVARDHYRMLLEKKFSADMASDLESRQKGERFVVLDPAQVPARPDRPNRLLIDVLALMVGLALGLGIAILLEIIGPTVKSELEVVEQIGAPVLAEVPWLQTSVDKRRMLIRNLCMAGTTTALAVAYAFMVVLSLRR